MPEKTPRPEITLNPACENCPVVNHYLDIIATVQAVIRAQVNQTMDLLDASNGLFARLGPEDALLIKNAAQKTVEVTVAYIDDVSDLSACEEEKLNLATRFCDGSVEHKRFLGLVGSYTSCSKTQGEQDAMQPMISNAINSPETEAVTNRAINLIKRAYPEN